MIQPHGGRLVNRQMSEQRSKGLDLSNFQTVDITKEMARDIENIGTGVYSPLRGFMNSADLRSVSEEMRLPTDDPWTIPILFDVTKEESNKYEEGDEILLTENDEPRALFKIEEKYTWDKAKTAEQVFRTSSPDHPGVHRMMNMNDVLLGGPVELIDRKKSPFEESYLKPMETRILFKEKGWKTIVGFQTRNAPHNGHEYVQKAALTFVDGIFINPVIGKKKAGDFTDRVILDTYKTLIDNYYLKERAVMSILQMEMRYAGPREAVHHSIIRKNYGCTHFIVGRDHAGVGDFYGPFDAHDIFEEFPDLKIVPLFFKSFFYCSKCGGVMNDKTCPHGDEYVMNFAGRRIRKMLKEGKVPDKLLMREEVAKIIIDSDQPFVE